MAIFEIKKAASDPVVRELIEHREKALHDEASRLLQAEREGIEKGMKKGTGKAKKDIARKMKQMGMASSIISEATGLKCLCDRQR